MFRELWKSIKKNEGYKAQVYNDHLGFQLLEEVLK